MSLYINKMTILQNDSDTSKKKKNRSIKPSNTSKTPEKAECDLQGSVFFWGGERVFYFGREEGGDFF